MKKQWKGFISGVLITVLALGLIGSVSATIGRRTVEIDYNNIKIELDGKQITPMDVNGNYVEPFAIDGTTYLPVRAVANAMDLEVGWDDSTKTVILMSLNASLPEPFTPEPSPQIRVPLLPSFTPSPTIAPEPTPAAPAIACYEDGGWVPDFGTISGLTPSYYHCDGVSVYCAYYLPTSDMINNYYTILEANDFYFNQSACTAIKNAGAGNTPVAFSKTFNSKALVVTDVDPSTGEYTIFFPVNP